MKQYKNAICQAKGFKASAVASGLKKANKLDLALIYSEVPAISCGVFTKNKFAAHPVNISKQHLKVKQAQAIVANSGNANCYNGKDGLNVAQETVKETARLLGLRENLVLIASTGIIGKRLDSTKIKNKLPTLVKSLSPNKGSDVAKAIMTTDTKPKELFAKFSLGNKLVTIGAVAKGAGMIAPDMATMLCFITTDALIEYSALKEALWEVARDSFNAISIDGCMSTNDSVIILANGLSKNKIITLSSDSFLKFKTALKEMCLGLAKMIVLDAEGATKFITIKISGAKDYAQAKKAALSVANSNLFKTALYGENRNLGRIVAAIGASGVSVKEEIKIECSSLKKRSIVVEVDLGVGSAHTAVYTSDLSPEYIRINAEYN